MNSSTSPKPSTPFFRKGLPTWIWPAVVAMGLLLSFNYFGVTAALNRSFYDVLQRIQANPSTLDQDAVLIMIDETALKEISFEKHYRWPWPRDLFAALLVAIQQGGAKHILVDLTFSENSEDEMKDFLLASYAAACPSVILAEQENLPQMLWSPDFQKKYPSLDLANRIAVVRHQPDADGILRWYNYENSLASKATETAPKGDLLIRWPSNLERLRELPKRVLVSTAWIRSGEETLKAAHQKLGDNDLDPLLLSQVLPQLPVPPGLEVVKGKTVFIGVNAAMAYDTKSTPLSSTEPGVMYHVAAWSNAEKQNWISLSAIPVLPVALLLCAIVLFLGMNEKIRVGSIVLLGTALVFIIVGSSWLLFQNGSWLPPTDPALGIILGFGAVAVHNWQTENRRKQQVQALFGSYVSSKVLDNLLENPDAVKLGGERRQLTIYFSDLAGFTDMSEGMKPEQLLEVVNIYLDEMSPFILENGGYLDKYIGDAIMGVFGAPEILENHAISACKAALESRDHLLVVSARMEKERGVKLHARIGINTGDIIVGNVGSRKKLNYTVVGDAVNLASRLEGANKEFGTTIMLGENTVAMLDGRFAIRPLELLQVKGKKKPVQTFELFEWTDKLSSEQKDLLHHFHKGYAAYQKRDFATSRNEFEIASQIDPRDKLSRLYSDRCAQYLLEPPPPDWDGVFVMTKK